MLILNNYATGYVLMYLQLYCDESCSHDTANPNITFLGACVLSSEEWLEFEKNWSEVLREYKVSAFRASDCNASKGQFIGWDGKKKDNFRLSLMTAVRNSGHPSVIWLGVDNSVFTRVCSEFAEVRYTPYEFLCYWLVSCSRGGIRGMADTLEIIFEDGRDVRAHVRRQMQIIQEAEPRITKVTFLPKADCTRFQVADFIAYEGFKSQSEGLRLNHYVLTTLGSYAYMFPPESHVRQFFTNIKNKADDSM